MGDSVASPAAALRRCVCLGVSAIAITVAACGDGEPPQADADLTVLCQNAIPLSHGATIDTCNGTNLIDHGCGRPNTKEVVVAFTAPAPYNQYAVASSGAAMISLMNDTCTATTQFCQTEFQFTSSTMYVVVEDPMGGCGSFDLRLIGPIQGAN